MARKDSRTPPPVSEGIAQAIELLVTRPSPQAIEHLCDSLLPHTSEQRALHLRNSRLAARPEIVERLVERSFALRKVNPQKALEIGQAAVDVAAELPGRGVPACLAADSLAQAWGNLGNCLRLANDLEAAGGALKTADLFLAAGSGDAQLAAHLLRWRALLCKDQRRFEEAATVLAEAQALYKQIGDPHRAGLVQLTLSAVHSQAGRLPEALAALGEGGRAIDLEEEPELALDLFHNVVLYLTEVGDSEMAIYVLRHYGWFYQFGEPLRRIRGVWVRGRLVASLGDWKAATACFEAVRRAWVRRRMSYDAALVTLELALAWLERGWPDKVAQLAREMYPVFVAQDISREASATLLLFAKAAQGKTLTRELLAGLTQKLRTQPATAKPQPSDEGLD